MVWRACRARQSALEAVTTLKPDATEEELHAVVPTSNPWCCNRIVMEVSGSNHNEPIVDLKSIGYVQSMGSDKEV